MKLQDQPSSERITHPEQVEMAHLAADQWEIYRDIRLKGLKEDPQAFGRSFAEEKDYPKEKWIDRVNNPYNMVALEKNEAIGTASAHVTEEEGIRTAHIVGVFVNKEARGRGVGSKLISAVLDKIKSGQTIGKVDLSVNKD